MSIVRAVDFENDWLFGQGQANYLSYNAQIEQDINTRLQAFLGNCFFDLGAGIDWFNLLGNKNATALDLAIRAVILNTQYVTSLTELSLIQDDATRNFSVVYSVTTVYTGVIQSTIGLLLTEGLDILTTQDGDFLHA